MLRRVLLGMSHNDRAKELLTQLPVSSGIVSRFIAGEETEDAVRIARGLANGGLLATLDHLGEDTTDVAQADAARDAYVELLSALRRAGLTGTAEVSVKLTALGMVLPAGGRQMALDNARIICAAARNAGTTVTLDMEDSSTTDAILEVLQDLRQDYPETGAVVQAYLHRTEADCERLATQGSRVRLCKGAYREPASVAYQSRREVDRSYVRCLKTLMSGEGYPMVATHDPRLVEIAGWLAHANGREPGTYEYQMLHGIRPEEQLRLAGEGERVRVYVPYGLDWYGYMMRRLAERPANVAFFARSLATKT